MKFAVLSLICALAMSAAPTPSISKSNGAQDLNGVYILATSVGVPATLDASGSTHTGALSCAWSMLSQPSGSAFSFTSPNACSTLISTTKFGTVQVRLTATDDTGSATQDIKIGGVIAPSGKVDVAAEFGTHGDKVANVTGPMLRLGLNPWSWQDNREVAAGALQIAQQATIWKAPWLTASTHGTVKLTDQSNVLEGSGTQFKTDFCAGGTTPDSANDFVQVWYPLANPDYAGQFGRWTVQITGCTDQTHMTLGIAFNVDYPETMQSFSTLSYNVLPHAVWAPWFDGNNPGNYYDNVLAFYILWLKSGIDDFRDAARYLENAFWVGYINYFDGAYLFGASGRGNGGYTPNNPKNYPLGGLVIWAWDTGADIWSGMSWAIDTWHYNMIDRAGPAFGKNFNVAIGDERNNAYMLDGAGLYYLNTPISLNKSVALDLLDQAFNNLLVPLESNGNWYNLQQQPPEYQFPNGRGIFGNPAGTIYVNVVDGSRNITVHGATIDPSVFQLTFPTPYIIPVWFCGGPQKARNCWDDNTFGNNGVSPPRSAADIGGDTVAYKVSATTQSDFVTACSSSCTHAVLTHNYSDADCPSPTGCNKTMQVAGTAGLGWYNYMRGAQIGVMATRMLDSFVAAGYTANVTALKAMIARALPVLASGIDAAGLGMPIGNGFPGCTASPISIYCDSGNASVGESMRGFAQGYKLFPTPANKAIADQMQNAMWANPIPDAGYPAWTTPIGNNGPCPLSYGVPYSNCYLFVMNDYPDPHGSHGGEAFTPNYGLDDKWLGFHFGFGAGDQWPAIRSGIGDTNGRSQIKTGRGAGAGRVLHQ